jgi:DNA-directed RNA polymerase specialized sigma24 family protein
MFGFGAVPSEVEMVAATDEYEVYERLRAGMLASARRNRVPENDVEDVIQDALVKLLGEHVRPGGPSLDRRAHTALHDKRVEHWRRERRRAPRLAPLNLPPDENGYEQERVEMASLDATVQMLELRDLVEAIAGRDAMLFALLKSCRATESDIAALLGWSPERAAAARVQLGRKKALIANAINDTLN